MAFSIQITEEQFDYDSYSERAMKGFIQIGSFREELFISLEVWSASNYRQQWQAGLQRIFTTDRSCLITSMRNLTISDYIDCWMLYRFDDEVVFQNHIFLATQINGVISGDTVYNFIPEREITTAEGQKISEWKVALCDIKMFLGTCNEPQ